MFALTLMRRFTSCLYLAALTLVVSPALAQVAGQVPIKIGILSFEPKPLTISKWAPMAQYLQAELGQRFQIEALDYEALSAVVKSKSIDFVFTNPEHYVVLRNAYGVSPMATLNARVASKPVSTFGGVIFSRADASGLEKLEDAKDKRISAVGLYSLGGFLAQADEFRKSNVNLQSSAVKLQFVGTPHDKVVEEVMSGRADIGLVRTGVLERMARQGKLDLAQVRLLNAQSSEDHPVMLSTVLYPEWPFAAMPQTDRELVRRVALALLSIPSNSSIGQAGEYAGFIPPANYAPVEELLRRLEVYPSLDSTPIWRGIWQLYSEELEIAAFLLCLAGSAAGVYFWFANRRLTNLQKLYRQAQSGLKITAAAFESQMGIIVTDPLTRIVRANDAFCKLFGYSESEILGAGTTVLRSPTVQQGTLRAAWPQLQAKGRWQGQIDCLRKDGTEIPCIVAITALREESGAVSGFVGSFIDISVQLQAEAQARRLAQFDPLTDLPNRRLLIDRLGTEIELNALGSGLGALLFIDLDEFKELNDTYGHVMGDQLLCEVAKRLRQFTAPKVLAGRLGGDEFVMMLSELSQDREQALTQACHLAAEVRKIILQPYEIRLQNDVGLEARTLHYRISGSIGVTIFGERQETTSEVFKRADVAMYLAKQAGKNAVKAYDELAQKAQAERVALGTELAGALSRGQLSLFVQLQTTAEGVAVGAECLLRWFHPVRGMVPPMEFIPIAESSGAILAIGDWVLEQACLTLARWAHEPRLAALTLSVNVSPRQFAETDFTQHLAAILKKTGAIPNRLCIEITEGIVLQEIEQTIEKMLELQNLGISFSVDDFGTGYSSLAYLHRLPLRQVKIDKTFVFKMPGDAASEAIALAILAMSRSMGFEALAEGVETHEQFNALRNMGCERFQGYLFGKPIAISEFEKKLCH